MPSRRPGLSTLLIAGAVVLIVSIYIGQRVGDRVLLQTVQRSPIGTSGVTPVPVVDSSDRTFQKQWKRLQVAAAATDPAFPDPRVTRPPTPRPLPPPPTPRRTPIPLPTVREIYTPPPLPIPIVSHDPNEVSTEPPAATQLTPP